MARACAPPKRRRNGLAALQSFGPPLNSVAMAVTVLNDFDSTIEVQDDNGQWRVVYPKHSVKISGEEAVKLPLREEPMTLHRTCVRAGILQASQDFGELSCRGRALDTAEQHAIAQEKARKKEAASQQRKMIQDQARKKRSETRIALFLKEFFIFLLPLVSLLVLALLASRSAVAAALLAVPAACCCGCLGYCVGFYGPKHALSDHQYGWHGRTLLNAVGLLGLAAVAWMTLRNAEADYWWTGLMVLPIACCSVGWWTVLCCAGLGAFGEDELDEDYQAELRSEREEADRTVKNRTIRFDGRVIPERGRPCVASWPGKYEGAWEALVAGAREGDVSAAVVFLPDGTEDHGQHDPIPEAEGLEGRCWCTPLYGEEKPWGCRWWSRWLKNVEIAVESGAELEVYFMANLVGRGKVESFQTAGKDQKQVQGKLTQFKDSPHYLEAVAAGLNGLSREPREDSTSRYSRELHRLFLAWLPAEEAEILQASEGLGNSQKAEVAWLERKGYQYREVDVSTWLTGNSVGVREAGSLADQPSTPCTPTLPHEVPASTEAPHQYGRAISVDRRATCIRQGGLELPRLARG